MDIEESKLAYQTAPSIYEKQRTAKRYIKVLESALEEIRAAVDKWCGECAAEAKDLGIDLRCEADPESVCWPEQCKAIIGYSPKPPELDNDNEEGGGDGPSL